MRTGEGQQHPEIRPGSQAYATAQPTDLRRVIGYWSGVAIMIGATIGSGIFRTPASIAARLSDPQLILALWAMFGIISVCGALTVAELASLLPRTGGAYVFLKEAYGDAPAFVFGWLSLLVTVPSAVAALCTFFAELAAGLLFPHPGATPGWVVPAIAAATILVLTLVNLLDVRIGAGLQNVLTAIKVGALALLILAVFVARRGSFAHFAAVSAPFDHSLFAALAAAAVSVIWTYDGWINISLVAGEIRAPDRLMKRIILTGMLTVVVLYLGANTAYLYMLPLPAIAAEKSVASRVMTMLIGPSGGAAIGFCIMMSAVGAANALMLTRARVAYAQANDGLSFKLLGRCHPKWATPYVAVLVLGAVAIILVLVLRDFDALTTYFVVVEWFALIFAVAAVFRLRKRMPDAPRPFRTPAYPWVPLTFVVGTSLGLTAILWGELGKGSYAPLVGLAIAISGFPVYGIWQRTQRRGRG
ncbi:MAG: amino acid permease [Acidobacteria bacterium]|jgi:amino acid transporter|nr:amino acid permease [Acidobacteriota bacterium]